MAALAASAASARLEALGLAVAVAVAAVQAVPFLMRRCPWCGSYVPNSHSLKQPLERALPIQAHVQRRESAAASPTFN
eukprot:3606110-Pleurochrysis_carterae.AAC.1